MQNDPISYMHRAGVAKGMSKTAERTSKRAKAMPANAKVTVQRETPAPDFGKRMKASTPSQEGNESVKYEALERKTPGVEHFAKNPKFLREGHNTSKSMKPGGGGRFAKMTAAIEKTGKSPERAKAIAAAAGRKKYGAAQMAKWSAAGRKRAAKGK
jgi:hypothetical protein